MIFVLFLGRDGWVGGYLMLPPHEGKIRRRFGGSGAGVLPRPSAQSNLHHVWDWELGWDGTQSTVLCIFSRADVGDFVFMDS